jgi:hypothetical protein
MEYAFTSRAWSLVISNRYHQIPLPKEWRHVPNLVILISVDLIEQTTYKMGVDNTIGIPLLEDLACKKSQHIQT